jgi:hypothetical protein
MLCKPVDHCGIFLAADIFRIAMDVISSRLSPLLHLRKFLTETLLGDAAFDFSLILGTLRLPFGPVTQPLLNVSAVKYDLLTTSLRESLRPTQPGMARLYEYSSTSQFKPANAFGTSFKLRCLLSCGVLAPSSVGYEAAIH